MSVAPTPQPALKPDVGRILARQSVRLVVFFAIQAAVLFIASGRWNWISAWVYIVFCMGAMAGGMWVVARHDPKLIAERVSAFQQARGRDKWLMIIIVRVMPIAFCLVAGLDSRFGWSPRPGLGVRALAAGAAILACLFSTWAMLSNRFFSSMVRIQKERGHAVVTGGPYRFVRHPGYVGMAITQLAFVVMLGTLWAFVPSGLVVAALLARTAREDALLQRELAGYKEYAARVRYRLLPGVW